MPTALMCGKKDGDVLLFTKEEYESWKAAELARIEAAAGRREFSSPVRRFEKTFVNQTYLAVLWGSDVYALSFDGEVVSLNVSHPGKQRRCGWGRYVNLYYAYTPRELRRKGHATSLQRALEVYWRDRGLDRLKSLVGSYGGFRFHRALGHSFWGVNDKNELLVDAPLCNNSPLCRKDFPEGTTPRHARGVTKSITPYGPQQLYAYLTSEECPYFGSIPEGDPDTLYPEAVRC